MMKISDKGLNIIKEFEGFRSHPYKDIAGVCTIGYGTTVYPDGRRVQCDDEPISESIASDIMRTMIDRLYGAKVNEYVEGIPTSQEQFDAMVSLAYNIGTGAFSKSTLLKRHLERNYGLAAQEFHKWDKAGGQVVSGLVRRRDEERRLYELIA